MSQTVKIHSQIVGQQCALRACVCLFFFTDAASSLFAKHQFCEHKLSLNLFSFWMHWIAFNCVPAEDSPSWLTLNYSLSSSQSLIALRTAWRDSICVSNVLLARSMMLSKS